MKETQGIYDYIDEYLKYPPYYNINWLNFYLKGKESDIWVNMFISFEDYDTVRIVLSIRKNKNTINEYIFYNNYTDGQIEARLESLTNELRAYLK